MKDIYVINNETYNLEGIIDEYASFIWTDRYNEAGDFELYLPVTEKNLSLLKLGYYLWIDSSEHQMIIENIRLSSSLDSGNMMTVSGQSLESLLMRRVVWTHETFNGNIQNQLKKLINNSFISPNIANRKVPNFAFVDSTDETVTSATYENDENSDLLGTEIYDVANKACKSAGLGFKLTFDDSHVLQFALYNGIDRSYAQDKNPWIIVSPAFDNVASSDYQENAEDYKNYILVSGIKTEEVIVKEEDEDGEIKETTETKSEEVLTTAGDETASGLNRREIYVNASDIQNDEVPDFIATLKQRGTSELENYKVRHVYDGQINSDITYVYNKDYFIGDIIQLENDMGIRTRVRITGFIISIDTSGTSSYPEFEFIESDETI